MGTPTQRLVDELRKTGYNQPEIADMINKSTSTVNRWFSGETKTIYKKDRESIANEMGIDIEYVETGVRSRTAETGVPYAASVDLPPGGKLSADQLKEFLRQIESIARFLRDSL